MKKTIIGIIGCGNIAPAYIKGSRAFDFLDLAYCADQDQARAEAFGKAHGLKALSMAELLAEPTIEVILNLTVPLAHAEVSLTALEKGKHIYSEKPLAVTWAEGREILETAERLGLQVGCAPDTFLGGALQTCRQLIDDGQIGKPVAATAFMTSHGPESWHPNPFFFYQVGGGPLLDMGPYYLTALIHLLGPVKQVIGLTRASFPTRKASSEEHFGKEIPVEIPTHISALLDFEDGAMATIIMSFDIWHANLPRIEVYGAEGTLSVPDPNNFGGPVGVRLAGASDWTDVPLRYSTEVSRGIGLADMVSALNTGKGPRPSGLLAGHVLEIMEAIQTSSTKGTSVEISTRPKRPAPLPVGWGPGETSQ